MDAKKETESTAKHDDAAPGRYPALIVVGSAERPAPETIDPIFRIAGCLTIRRDSSAAHPGDGTTWAIPDRLVSGEHARITRAPGAIEIRDLGSTNGTFVNGRRIDARTTLTDGDLIGVGAHAAVFRVVTKAQIDAIGAEAEAPFGPVATSSPALALVCHKLRRLAPANAEVLLTGETGVGKEVYAQAIHHASGRQGRFLAINCAALPRELVESELFGYTRGAHSQATRSKKGLLEDADGGTLFLDEIGEMPSEAQAKLLRFLQTRTYNSLGSSLPRQLDVRVIAATNRRVGGDGEFGLRPDLAARLGAQPVILPPLRSRIEDLGRLIAHFGRPRSTTLTVSAFRALCGYTWPGNIRELEKVLAEAFLLNDETAIGVDHLPDVFDRRDGHPAGASLAPPGRRRRELPPREVIEQLLTRYEGNVAEVARSLDRQWAVVWRSIVRHGIDIDRYRR